MKITGINQNQTQVNKNNKPAFGMNVFLEGDAAKKLATAWFPKGTLIKLMPEINELKAINNDPINVHVYGDMEKYRLEFVGTASNEKISDIYMTSNVQGNTFEPKSISMDIIDGLMPTLKGIQERLNIQILATKNRTKISNGDQSIHLDTFLMSK